ncbi:MAG: peptide chain release factor N(5)-glutamine methyltransferase [Flavobacteriales bacterium]|nr:peptide chain release factor N(5)-glutamine methyltransferase [Flavobacteriales bacterium]
MSTLTYSKFSEHFFSALSPSYEESELRAIFFILIEDLENVSRTSYHLKKEHPVNDWKLLSNAVERLLNFEPIQYITGVQHFYGNKLKVKKGVLIPRPETEELVDLILSSEDENNRIAGDLGSGSGCIALSLKTKRPQWKIMGFDVSKEALDVAKMNANALKLDVDFLEADISSFSRQEQFDILVSNPPYITRDEESQMDENVKSYEPHIALFVDHKNPLYFYQKIIDISKTNLNSEGKLYLEINPLYAEDLVTLLKRNSFIEISVFKDSFGKNRFIYGKKV